MNILLKILTTISYTLIEPYFLIILFLLGLTLYRKNKRICKMQKMIMGQQNNDAIELTMSQIVLGIFGGCVASIIMGFVGVVFNESSSIELVFLLSIIFMFISPRFICFSYSASILGLLSLILMYISKALNNPSINFINIDIPQILTMIAILHFVEGILVILDGKRGAIPVFTNKENKIIGGFAFQRYWVFPIALFIVINSSNLLSLSVEKIAIPNWWPLINMSSSTQILKNLLISTIPFYGVIGYSSVTFTKSKEYKTLTSGLCIILYSVILFGITRIALKGIIFKFLALIFCLVGHELIIFFQKYIEIHGKPKYVSDDDGIVVLEVVKKSISYKMGIRSGDILLEVNDKIINTEQDIKDSINKMYGQLSFKIKNKIGKIQKIKYESVSSYNKLGIVVVPKNFPNQEDVINVGTKKFKEVLNNIKNKDRDD